MITKYAVRHIPTGFFLPETKKGYTTTEPMDPVEHSPRLHKSHRSASQAMHAWARGKHIANWQYGDGDYPSGGMYVEDIRIQEVKGRDINMMEVVEVKLYVS